LLQTAAPGEGATDVGNAAEDLAGTAGLDAQCGNNVVPADAVFQMHELRCSCRSSITNARTVLFPEIQGYSCWHDAVFANPVQQAGEQRCFLKSGETTFATTLFPQM